MCSGSHALCLRGVCLWYVVVLNARHFKFYKVIGKIEYWDSGVIILPWFYDMFNILVCYPPILWLGVLAHKGASRCCSGRLVVLQFRCLYCSAHHPSLQSQAGGMVCRHKRDAIRECVRGAVAPAVSTSDYS